MVVVQVVVPVPAPEYTIRWEIDGPGVPTKYSAKPSSSWMGDSIQYTELFK
jgi:hypothetical protein